MCLTERVGVIIMVVLPAGLVPRLCFVPRARRQDVYNHMPHLRWLQVSGFISVYTMIIPPNGHKISVEVIRHFEWCYQVAKRSSKFMMAWDDFEENLCIFFVIIVPADGLVPLGAKPSAGTSMMKLWSCICGKVDTLKPEQNGWYFADNILRGIFLNKNHILIKISLKFAPKVLIINQQ